MVVSGAEILKKKRIFVFCIFFTCSFFNITFFGIQLSPKVAYQVRI